MFTRTGQAFLAKNEKQLFNLYPTPGKKSIQLGLAISRPSGNRARIACRPVAVALDSLSATGRRDVALTDITDRSSKMPPNTAILYPRAQPDSDSPRFMGITRITQAGMFWVAGWERTVNGKTVLELKFSLKESR